MATRSITTTRPAVACDVCGRNLLRGELPDVFLAGGQRRTVCELCVTRATHEGWLREADGHPIPVRPPRGRRARTLMGRLRQLRDPPPAELAEPLPGGPVEYEPPWNEPDAQAASAEAAEPIEEIQDPAPAPASSAHASDAVAAHQAAPEWQTPRSVRGVPTNADLKAARALDVFNSGEHPRRMAGVARSLGAPYVVARSVPGSGSMVSIVVAWELCWYRYEVDLAEEGAGARLVVQGMELEELDEADRVANAAADERGELQMLS